MPVPVFSVGETLTSAAMNAVGLWRVTGCTVSSVGGTAATASNGVITVGTSNTSVTISNAFSANYDNYIVTYTGGTTTTTQDIRFRLGSTSTSYYGFFTYGSYTSNTVNGFARSNQGSFEYFGQGSTSGNNGYCVIQNPFAATRTGFSSTTLGFGTTGASGTFNGFLNDTTSYSAFTLFIDSGSMSGGKIRVYGYNN